MEFHAQIQVSGNLLAETLFPLRSNPINKLAGNVKRSPYFAYTLIFGRCSGQSHEWRWL